MKSVESIAREDAINNQLQEKFQMLETNENEFKMKTCLHLEVMTKINSVLDMTQKPMCEVRIGCLNELSK